MWVYFCNVLQGVLLISKLILLIMPLSGHAHSFIDSSVPLFPRLCLCVHSFARLLKGTGKVKKRGLGLCPHVLLAHAHLVWRACFRFPWGCKRWHERVQPTRQPASQLVSQHDLHCAHVASGQLVSRSGMLITWHCVLTKASSFLFFAVSQRIWQYNIAKLHRRKLISTPS